MDLNAPLGKTPPKEPAQTPARARRGRGLVFGIGALVAIGALGAAGLALWRADPHGGEPYEVAAIPPQQARPTPEPPRLDPVTTSSIAPAAPLAPQNAPSPNVAAKPGGPLIIDVAKVLAAREQGDVAATPNVASVPPAAPATPVVRPRIAIFVSGMGLSAQATRTATEMMPSAVSLAFVPYGDTVAAAVGAAKARGHEILLQIPMQNAGGAPSPGPHALVPGEPASQVDADLAWMMGRITGYDGVANLLGAPVTSDRNVMGALLKTVADHGLFYLDDGTSRRSLGQALAQTLRLPALRADVVLDATADPAVVHANLEALAALAKHGGSAIGMASGLPDHLAAIAAFAAGLPARGIDLVPVSALAGRGPTTTVAK